MFLSHGQQDTIESFGIRHVAHLMDRVHESETNEAYATKNQQLL